MSSKLFLAISRQVRSPPVSSAELYNLFVENLNIYSLVRALCETMKSQLPALAYFYFIRVFVSRKVAN